MNSRFYSYLWLRQDGSPYYVGKGTGNRAWIRFSHNVHPPTDSKRILVFPMANEAEAFESEVAIIALFGRKDLGTGCLRNLTDGGEGAAGHQISETTRQKMSQATRGRVLSVEHRQRLSQALKGREFSASHKQHLSAAHDREFISSRKARFG